MDTFTKMILGDPKLPPSGSIDSRSSWFGIGVEEDGSSGAAASTAEDFLSAPKASPPLAGARKETELVEVKVEERVGAAMVTGSALAAGAAVTTGPGAAEEEDDKDEDGLADGGGEPRGPVRGSSAWLQLKLMLWKHMLTKLRDRSQIVASVVVPTVTFLVMWLLRKKPYRITSDPILVNVAFILQPLAQVASLVTEKELGLKVLLTTSGLSPAIYTLSWFLAEASGAAATSLLMAILCRITNVLEVNGTVSFFMVLALLFCYLCASAAFAYCLSQPFTKPSTAAPAAFLAYMGLLVAFLILGIKQDKLNRAIGCSDKYPTTVTPASLFGGDDGGGDVDWWGSANTTVYDDDDDGVDYSRNGTVVWPPVNCTGLLYSFGYNNSFLCSRSLSPYDDTGEMMGICLASCGRCKPKDFVDVEGWTDWQQARFMLVPTFALSMAVSGFPQGKPPVWFHVPLRGLCLGTLFLTILGWYLGEIIPGDLGIGRQPWFILYPSFWLDGLASARRALVGCCQRCQCCLAPCRCCCGDATKTKIERSKARRGAQAVSSGSHNGDDNDGSPSAAVVVDKIRREFGSHVAVDSVSFRLEESEIYALLGHNGAGKTTTISMLTGLLERTSGDATVYGHKISDGMAPIRTMLGICPQHDVLFDYLTIAEHIDLFARLKGATLEEMGREREAMLEAFELGPRADYFPRGLSGGMKRKACVALAVTGDTRLVVLDEPTTGLDPGARRRLWDTLAMLKRGRTILLTTHFMDEAEVLGDRIGIMKDGQLSCEGTAVELKHKYGCGYDILIQQDLPPATEVPPANPLVLASSGIATAAGGRGGGGCGGRDALVMELERFVLQGMPGSTRHYLHPVPSELRFTLPLEGRAQFGAFLGRLEAAAGSLKIKNYGISMAPFEEVFLRVGSETAVAADPKAGGGGSGGGGVDFTSLPQDDFYRSVGASATYVPTFKRQLLAVFARRLHLARHGLGVDLHRLGLLTIPRRPLGTKRGHDNGHDFGVEGGDLHSSVGAGTSAVAAALSRGAVHDLPGALAKDLAQAAGFLRGVQTWLLVGLPLGAAAAAIYLRADTKALFFMFGRTGKHPSPTEATVPNLLVVGMITAGYLFAPGLIAEVLVAEREGKVRNLLAVMGVGAGPYWSGHALADLCLLAVPTFATWVAFEAAGLDDFTDAGAGGASGGGGVVFALQALFVLELLAFSYAMSHAFSSPAFAMALLPAVCLALLVLPVFAMLLIAQFDSMATSKASDRMGMRELFSILFMTWAATSPLGFLLASTFVTVFPHEFANDHTARYSRIISEDFSPVWAMVLMSVCKTAAMAAAAVYLDVKNYLPLAIEAPFETPPEAVAEMDEDVRAEYYLLNGGTGSNSTSGALEAEAGVAPGYAARANEDGSGEPHAIEYHHLRKVYANAGVKSGVNVAVRDTNLHVAKGECFGLLGPNGAGKSTTVSMMTRHTPPTRGDARVNGHSVRTDFVGAARHMGVVTQDNSLYRELDAVEHLWLFARVRGVPDDEIPQLVDESLTVMELKPHCRKPSKRLSGGMKRKLCTALSLIGNPAVVVMDEPSSGLDPSSRRNLWKVINETMKFRAVVLTTHLLDEAEALCGRIAIMTHGQVQCVGSAQHLRGKFGSGYEVVLTTKEVGTTRERNAAFAKVNAFVGVLFKGKATLQNRHSRMLTYNVPAKDISVPRAFAALEEKMGALQLDNYVICQPTLEQVFLKFTVENDREHSHLTNEAEKALAAAFDDADVRIAEKAKSRCFGCERPTHRRNLKVCCCLVPVFFILALMGYPIYEWICDTFLGGPFKIVDGAMSEWRVRSRCHGRNNSLEELSAPLDYSFTHRGYLQDNASNFCPGIELPYLLNPLWDITNFTLAVGVSGDFDSKSGALGPDIDWNAHKDIWNEQAKVYVKQGDTVPPLEHWSFKWDWSNFDDDKDDDYSFGDNDFGNQIGSCGGCPHDKGEWGSHDDRRNCTGRKNGRWDVYEPVEGRCQLDCEDNPFIATCVPEVTATRNQWGYWSSSKKKVFLFRENFPANNFTVSILLDEGVNIRSCVTGFVAEVKVAVAYTCNGTEAECAVTTDYDGGVARGVTSSCTNDDGYHYGYNKTVLLIVVWSTLLGLFQCSIIWCICACCGMCCTRTPEDDNDEDKSKKKGKCF